MTHEENDTIYLTPDALAKRWQMSKDTLTNWRCKKQGPGYVKIGAGRNTKVLYKLDAVIEYENQNTVETQK